MPKNTMRDLVVLLPGFAGSTLEKHGKRVWTGVIGHGEPGHNEDIEQLTLGNDGPNSAAVDNVAAASLVADVHMVPGLWKIDNYSSIKQVLERDFTVTCGSVGVDDGGRANYLEFSYDWRRDNRVTALRLREFIDDRLEKWRRHSGAEDAKTILIAHSMGGLAARYYLEVLGGWQKCRLLVTLGTPHRGAVRALHYIVNGYKHQPSGVTHVMRSFTSVYQLLPFYRVVQVGGGKYHRVPVCQDLEGVDKERAKEARKFHMEIKEAVTSNRKEQEYLDEFKVVTMVGVWQPTLLSAAIFGKRLEAFLHQPTSIMDVSNYGDGIVPYPSAIPFESPLDDQRIYCFAERHSCLQNNAEVLRSLRNVLNAAQGRGPGEADAATVSAWAEREGISLDVHDLYSTDEEIDLEARVVNQSEPPRGVRATIRSAGAGVAAEPGGVLVNGSPAALTPDGAGLSLVAAFREDWDHWDLTVSGLPEGLYRIEVSASDGAGRVSAAVHDFFQVLKRP
jgi:hypothetical protein